MWAQNMASGNRIAEGFAEYLKNQTNSTTQSYVAHILLRA